MQNKIEDLSKSVQDTYKGLSDTARKQLGLPTSDSLEYKANEAARSGKQFVNDAGDLVVSAGKKAGEYVSTKAPEVYKHISDNLPAYGAGAAAGLGYLSYKRWKNRGV